MKPCCEFSRKVPLNRIQKKDLFIKIEADEEEKKALAVRFDILDVKSLYAEYRLQYLHGAQIRAKGKIIASVIQNCVVSLEDFELKLNEVFELLFIPSHKIGKELEAIDDPDVIPYIEDEIDLGEVTAEQLALLLDPYPHKPNASHPLVLQENEISKQEQEKSKESPFKALENLKNIQSNKKK